MKSYFFSEDEWRLIYACVTNYIDLISNSSNELTEKEEEIFDMLAEIQAVIRQQF